MSRITKEINKPVNPFILLFAIPIALLCGLIAYILEILDEIKKP